MMMPLCLSIRSGPRGVMLVATACLLAACSSTPNNITLADPAQNGTPRAAGTSPSHINIATKPVRYVHVKPGCSSVCPTIEVASIAVPQAPKLTALIDHVLAFMTGLDVAHAPIHQTLADYEAYFFQTAQARDRSEFVAEVRGTYRNLITVELRSEQFVTGAPHGVAATQFLNWQRDRERVLAMNEALVPGQQDAFMAAAQRAHARWKTTQADYQRDPATFDRMWPFQQTDNFALTRDGMILKYDAYEIAPYASGQPELLLPYGELTEVLDPAWLPH